ncbi:hypothetical protein BN8_05893 [Fibrisoma limi BUZ 3]|uniref:Secretion system C-terminal sorting domain-containing protein n=1 Tax=Fibrisoma limi BUZ 3 TaxID=1185876 RepID=I2GRL5_9BACT|nr:M12 family metallo-peptidase [Fibrisoma limi]CCH56543.1 hypothetical protein BN8_05893 [Fibrisoma limi BUZ 3]
MKISKFTTKAKHRACTLLVAFGLQVQWVLAQELFTLQQSDKSRFSANLQGKMEKIEKNPVHKRTMYVQVGNLAKIQQNGKLTFTIPNTGGPITFLARRVEAESERDFTWVGKSEDGLYQAIFVSKQGKLSGSIESKYGNYQLYGTDESVSLLMEVDLSKSKECKAVGRANDQEHKPKSGARQDACQEATRVLILYTQAAANFAPDINQLADLCIQQYNTALNNSSIGNQVTNTLVNAGVAFIPFTEGVDNDSQADAFRISQRADAQNLRNQTNADIVMTLTGDVYTTTFGSVVGDIPANNSSAYAVVEINQASLAGAYTFLHEAGHIFGGRHDHNFDSNPPSYAHGYQLPNQTIRTLMSVRNNGDLSRILHFSNPNVTFNGTQTGTATLNDVARRIGEVSATIGNFRQSITNPFYGYIEGTSYVGNSGTNQFEVAYQCITPISFEWSVSRDGFTFGSPMGWSEIIYPYISSSDNGLYYLRCRITLPGGQVSTIYKYVSVNICSGCRTEAPETETVNSVTLVSWPNPVINNTVNLKFMLPQEAVVSLTLTDSRASTVKKLLLGKLAPGNHQKQLDVTGLSPGLYVINLQAGSQRRSLKVLLSK